MATDKISPSSSSSSQVDHEDYIDMELSSSSSSSDLRYNSSSMVNSPPHRREFEFQMSSAFLDKETTTSPADELFYKGKFLPLHLPPRLQMVRKILQNATTITANDNKSSQEPFEEKCGSVPSSTNSNNNTPLESCSISPSVSCRVSCEMNPDEYFFEWSSEINSFIGKHPKKSWTKKLKKFFIGQKLKASTAYLKSLFAKSGCTNESSCAKAASDAEEDSPRPIASKWKESYSNNYFKVTNNSLFGKSYNKRHKVSKSNALLKSIEKEIAEDGYISQRRSFSGVIQWHSSSKSLYPSSISTSSSSSSFSFSSNGFYDLHVLKRSSSANSELENSIEGAIAHCKMSQQLISSVKNASEVLGPNCSLSASGINVCEDQQRPKIVSV